VYPKVYVDGGGYVLPVFMRLVCGVLFAGILLVAGVGRAESETMLASWYGPGFKGLPTATGEPYDPYGYTAAHKTLPLGTALVVSYGASSVEVTVNDRGPYVGERELDLSLGAAEALGLTQYGVDFVRYAYAGSAAYQYDAGGAAYDQYAAVTQASAAHEHAHEQYGYSSYSGYGYDDGAPATAIESYSGFVEDGSHADESYVESASYAMTGYVEAEIYVVSSGETLSGIAADVGISVEELAASSGVADSELIHPGQILYY
jgi:rare lipoprotein A